MPIPTTCPACKAVYQLSDALAGKNVRCKACGGTIPVAASNTPVRLAEGAQLTKTPGSPAKTKPLPTALRAEPAAPKELSPPTKRPFPLVAVLLVVAALGIVLLTGLAAVGGVTWYLLASSRSPSSVAESNTVAPSVTGTIKPAPLKQDREERLLSSPAGAVCVGGGGRFLILHLPRERKLAIFDVNEAKIVTSLSIADDQILFTAGLDKLFVYLPQQHLLQRWDLNTFKKEVDAPAPAAVKGLAMGSATQEPLIVQTATGLDFLDPSTFRNGKYTLGDGSANRIGQDGSPLRVSANGQLVTCGGVLIRMGNTYQPVAASGDALPSPDGQVLYGHEQLFSAEGRQVGERFRAHRQRFWFIPGVQGPYAIFYKQIGNGQDKTIQLGVYRMGETRLLATLPEVEGILELVDWQSGVSMPIDQHLFLIPDAQLLVFIPAGNDKLVLYRANIEQLIEKGKH